MGFAPAGALCGYYVIDHVSNHPFFILSCVSGVCWKQQKQTPSTNKPVSSQPPQSSRPPTSLCHLHDHDHHSPSTFNCPRPPLDIPMTMTMWQRHVTSPSTYAVSIEDDDLAQTVMMQVVVTVHISSGAQLDPSCPPSPLFTQKAGATSPSVTWQTTTAESRHVSTVNDR